MTSINTGTDSKGFGSQHQSCRLCLSEESLESVFKNEGLLGWIIDYLSIMVSTEDRLSHAICTICQIRLTEFHQFRLRCQDVQAALQSMISVEDVAPKKPNDQTVSNAEVINDSEKTLQLQPMEKEKQFRCEVCDMVFKIQRQLSVHKRIHGPLMEGKEFARRDHLDTNQTNKNREINELERTSNRQVHCASVEAKSRVEKESSNHKNSELKETATELKADADNQKEQSCLRNHDHQINEDKRTSTTDKVLGPVDGGIQFKCDICPKIFTSMAAVLRHLKRTHGPKDHECDICGYRFTLLNHLKRHLQKHTRNGDSKEDFCALKQSLQRKTAIVLNEGSVEGQTTTNFFECSECPRKFQTRRHLVAHHKYVHEKKIKCTLCSVFFVTKKRREIHMQEKHKQKDGTYKPLTCEVCHKIFLTTQEFTYHKRTHRKHACTVCNKLFRKSDTLQRHMRTHESTASSCRNDLEDNSSLTGLEIMDGRNHFDQPSSKKRRRNRSHLVDEKNIRPDVVNSNRSRRPRSSMSANAESKQHVQRKRNLENSEMSIEQSDSNAVQDIDAAGSQDDTVLLFEAEEYKIEPES